MSSAVRGKMLPDIYALITDLWCSPPDTGSERQEARKEADELVERWASVDKEGAGLLSRFLADDALSEEKYTELFELDPQCPLYLGSHSYDEPKTCANAGVSGRNDYMIELGGIYNHFGRKLNGKEQPDYLPLTTSFLSLTTERKDDPVREKFLKEYLLPFLAPMRSRLAELKTPYVHLRDALERVIQMERETQPSSEQRMQKVEGHVE